MSGHRTRTEPAHLRFANREGLQDPKPHAGRFLPSLTMEELADMPTIPQWCAEMIQSVRRYDELEPFSEQQARLFVRSVEHCRDVIRARKLAKLQVGGGAVYDPAEQELEL